MELTNPRTESWLTIFLPMPILRYTDYSSSVKEEEYILNILRFSMVFETFNLKYPTAFPIYTYLFGSLYYISKGYVEELPK